MDDYIDNVTDENDYDEKEVTNDTVDAKIINSI